MTFLLVLCSQLALAAFAFWCGWDVRGDIEWNRSHGITAPTGDEEPGT